MKRRSFLVLLAPAIVLVFGCRDRGPPADAAAKQQSSGAVATGLDSLTGAADSLYSAGDYARARTSWFTALARAKSDKNIAAEGRILTSLGLTEWHLGDYIAARARTDEARVLLETNRLRQNLPRTLNAIGLIAWDQGHLSEASELWRLTMKTAADVGDQEYVDKPAMNLGLWYAQIGDFDQARHSFATSLIAGRRLGIRPLELRSLVNLAMVANQMGEPRLALAWLDSAAKAGVERDFLADDNYRSQLALAAWSMGDPGVALAGLDSAIRRARAAGLRQSEAANLALMASIYWEAGDLSRALDINAQAETIHGQLGLPSEQGQNLHTAARIHMAVGQTRRARELAARALKLHEGAEDLPHQLDDRLLLAELGNSMQLAEAERTAAKIDTRSARTTLGIAKARMASAAGQPRRVLGALTAIDADLVSGLSAEVAEAEALRARAFASLKLWDSAAVRGRLAAAALERIRSGEASDLLRASFSSFRAETYGDLVGALIALGRTDEAFDVADAARGGWVQATSGRADRAALPGAEPALRTIAALEREIREREDEGLEAQELRDRLQRAEREYEIALVNAGATATGPSTAVMDAGRIGAALASDEALLAYFVAPEHLFVFTLTHEQLHSRVVPLQASDLEARVRLARQLLADPGIPSDEADAVMGALSRWLLGSVEAELKGVRRLIVVPHGVLTYLPFAALKTRDGKYLVERFSLMDLPSASFALRDAPNTSPEIARLKVTALAPQVTQLPGSAMEVSAIGRSYRGARILQGSRARESALRDALRAGAVAHVASHGVLNRVNPLFSRIELFPGKGASTDDDGRLEVHEVQRLEIRSPLVFLSGCETGLGPGGSRRYAPGEDYSTLAAAFLNAGAGQVVATLWAIPDTGAAVFATRFYTELERSGAADATAATQRALLAEPRYRHPYYWAGYRVAGPESKRRRGAVQ